MTEPIEPTEPTEPIESTEPIDLRKIAPGHYLFPHERWIAKLELKRQRTDRSRYILTLEQNFGPEGVVLNWAALAWAIPGGLVDFLGVFLLFVTSGPFAYWTIGLGELILIPGLIRVMQAHIAGRRFRAGRPFVRFNRFSSKN